MKKNRILSAFAAASLLLAGACSSDQLDPNGGSDDQKVVDPTEGVYLSVNFDLPTEKSTRSFTDDDNSSNSGTEVGQDYENSVKSVVLVLATFSNQFIAYATTEKIETVGTEGNSYRTTHSFQKTDLANYYNQADDMFVTDANGNHKINVYVFCNPTKRLLEILSDYADPETENNDQWFNAIGTWDEATGDSENKIWRNNQFLMSNISSATRWFPATIDDWDAYSSETTPFNLSGMNNFGRPNQVDNLTELGNIKVERVAARYDFRDGALDGYYVNGSGQTDKTYNGFKAQTYHVVLDSDQNPLIDVFLGRMSVVNMNKNYYFLRRVSNNGRMEATMSGGRDNDVQICGPERPWTYDADGSLSDTNKGNYVVDASATWKYSGSSEFLKKDFTTYLNYPFFDADGILDNVDESNGRWDTHMIKDVLDGGKKDNWNNQDGPNTGKYKIWRYLTEGTIPGINSQKNGVSNGIVFKGQMLPAREATESDDPYTRKLLKALEIVKEQSEEEVAKNHLIYSFGGHLYCTWEHIRRMAVYLALTDLSYNTTEQKWEYEIDTSVKLYNAVFGKGGFGKITFSVKEGADLSNVSLKNADFMIEGEGNYSIEDNQAQDATSPNAMFEKWHHNGYSSEEYYAFRDAVVNNGIKIYQESYDETLGGWAYYCYYYYWNRHNDNDQDGVMGPMEFAVVRNNVYKLAVTKIKQLGHPRIVVNDPDAPNPNTPDEKSDVYITVTCQTLPWVVRKNDIELK